MSLEIKWKHLLKWQTSASSNKYFLRLEITQTLNSIFISQQNYAEELLKKFQMQGCNVVSTPANTNEKLHASDGSGSANAKLFKGLIGGLIYLSHARLDKEC